MDIGTYKPPKWFWIVSAIALLWNLMGIGAYLSQVMMSPEKIAEAYGQVQAELIAVQPAWYTAVFALAVFGGALGCLGLLLRKNWAMWFLLLSLICVIIQNIYFAMSGAFEHVHGGAWVMTLMIPIIAVLLVLLARKAKASGWTG
jgi:uncharacterized membrane protein